MIRFILKYSRYSAHDGFRVDSHFTVDGDVVELEKQLRRGGCGESGFERVELIGAEVIEDAPKEVVDMFMATIARLENENARLRKALEENQDVK
jgi:hypothetical protein